MARIRCCSIRTKREVSARRQMAEALRWLSEARRQHCYVYGPLPIAAQGIGQLHGSSVLVAK